MVISGYSVLLLTMVIRIFLFVVTFQIAVAILYCGDTHKSSVTRFHFTAPCIQSKMNLLAARYLSSLKSCKELAVKKRGLAINFVHYEFLHKAALNFSGETCLVFDCPELDQNILINGESVYDYYSAYSKPFASGNLTCVPGVGVFKLHPNIHNYTEALEVCKDENGQLAEVTKELWTNSLAGVLLSLHLTKAYIGINDIEQPGYLNSNGMALECVKYRAWSPGHPKPLVRGNQCGILTSKASWKLVPCTEKHPFICEIGQSGPQRPCRDIIKISERRRCVKRYRNILPGKYRNPQCGSPKSLSSSPVNRDKLNNSEINLAFF